MNTTPATHYYSPDGQWHWDGRQWLPRQQHSVLKETITAIAILMGLGAVCVGAFVVYVFYMLATS